jgi:hypothetical protein
MFQDIASLLKHMIRCNKYYKGIHMLLTFKLMEVICVDMSYYLNELGNKVLTIRVIILVFIF